MMNMTDSPCTKTVVAPHTELTQVTRHIGIINFIKTAKVPRILKRTQAKRETKRANKKKLILESHCRGRKGRREGGGDLIRTY